MSRAFYGLLVVVVLYGGYSLWRTVLFRRSSYYRVTKKSFSKLDAGDFGEYLIYTKLKYFERTGGKLLFNLYVPKLDGCTTEIDVVLIHPKGIFVIESKNFSGWIFGNESHEYWTQTLPSSRGFVAHKERFFNPILQNASHVLHLKHLCKLTTPIRSIVVFSDDCELKHVTVSKNKRYEVLQLSDLRSKVSEIMNQCDDAIYSEGEVESLYKALYPYSQVGTLTKRAHKTAMRQSAKK